MYSENYQEFVAVILTTAGTEEKFSFKAPSKLIAVAKAKGLVESYANFVEIVSVTRK